MNARIYYPFDGTAPPRGNERNGALDSSSGTPILVGTNSTESEESADDFV